MPLYQQGSRGKQVKQIQERLKILDFYDSAIDGIYGGGTESAVKAFQRANDLSVDGIVGSNTWTELFDEEDISESAILDETLSYCCLALTGSFETGASPPACFAGLSGDFDGQGISLGCLQWNFGQGSLQPLLNKMFDNHAGVMNEVFDNRENKLLSVLDLSQQEQLDWARSIQDGNELEEPWRDMFKELGHQKAFQKMQVEATGELFDAAAALAGEYNLSSERAVALMFDIKVQNGSISGDTENKIRKDIEELPDWEKGEVARLCIIANRRSEASKPQWVEDVRSRKLTIATGRGSVHGMQYVLDRDYSIRLNKAVEE